MAYPVPDFVTLEAALDMLQARVLACAQLQADQALPIRYELKLEVLRERVSIDVPQAAAAPDRPARRTPVIA